MRNLVVGMLIGSCVTLACMFGYQHSVRSSKPPVPERHETAQAKEAPILKKVIKAQAPRSPKSVSAARPRMTNEGDLAELIIQEILADQNDHEAVKDVEDKNDTIAAIEDLAKYHDARSRSAGYDLRQKVEELKKKGIEIVPDLVKILNGLGSQASKILAASVLGAINAELQDPEISELLSSQVVPMLEEVITGGADTMLKRRAIAALGEIKDEESAKVLASIVTGEANRFLKMYASMTLSREGTVDSAYQLLPALRNLDDDAELLLVASCIAQINTRTQDLNLANRLAEAVPRLQGIVDNVDESRRNKGMALSTLGTIGGAEANQVLMELVKGGENVDDRLQRSAIWAISRSGGPDLAEELGKVLQNENDASRQIDIASAIVSIASRNPNSTSAAISKSEAVPVLHRFASSSESAEIQRRAISTIGRVGDTSDIEALRQLGESDEKLQSAVSEAIRRIEQRAEGGDSNVRYGRFWGR